MVPAMRTITGLDELKQAEGEELGVSDWHQITQPDCRTNPSQDAERLRARLPHKLLRRHAPTPKHVRARSEP